MKTATRRQVVQADAGQRAQRAWAARVSGATWEQVADIVGFSSAGNACRAVTNYFGTLPSIDRETQRALWRDRLEQLWRYANRDAKRARPGALRAGVAVAQRAAALDGLDEQTRIAVELDSTEFEQLVQEFMRATGRRVPESDDVVAMPELTAETWDDEPGDSADDTAK